MRYPVVMIAALASLFLAVVAFAQTPVAGLGGNDAVSWDYAVFDEVAGSVTLFLVCLDGQPTAACARVPASAGVLMASFTGEKTYTWKLPALLTGPHTIAIQACTAGAAQCSPGASLAFVVQVVIKNPSNLRLTKAGLQ